jgi:uncharacterized caspase-like protein
MTARVVVAFLVLLLVPSLAQAQKRVALVIGNSAYKHAGTLANPRNDSGDVAAGLKHHGFAIIEGFDLDKVSMDRRIRDFASVLQRATVGVFFYAGHGMQVSGQNYLVPVDAELASPSALDFEMVRLDLVHRTMEREAQTNILFIDACRDNPLARNLARAMGTRSSDIGRGLAAVESGVGTLISFSTQPGNVALDGRGRNSPFAAALVKHMMSSPDDLSALLIDVRNDVMRETQNKQIPWEHSALRGRFYFDSSVHAASSNASVQPAVAAAAARLSEAAEAWDRTKDSNSIAVLEAYIARYKDAFYADLARARLAELKKQQLAASESPKPVSPVGKAVKSLEGVAFARPTTVPPGPSGTATLAGTWSWKVSCPIGSFAGQLVLRAGSGQTFSGQFLDRHDNIRNGRLDGNQLSFARQFQEAYGTHTQAWRGTLTQSGGSGARIVGSYTDHTVAGVVCSMEMAKK